MKRDAVVAATTNNAPAQLQPGAYWYIAVGEAPRICEKREGEDFVRFTNGGRQSWVRDHDRFVGPLPPPINQE